MLCADLSACSCVYHTVTTFYVFSSTDHVCYFIPTHTHMHLQNCPNNNTFSLSLRQVTSIKMSVSHKKMGLAHAQVCYFRIAFHEVSMSERAGKSTETEQYVWLLAISVEATRGCNAFHTDEHKKIPQRFCL